MLLKGKTRVVALLLIALCLTACAAQTAPEPAPAAQSEETLVPAPEQPEAPQPESLAEVQPQVAYTPHAAYKQKNDRPGLAHRKRSGETNPFEVNVSTTIEHYITWGLALPYPFSKKDR